MDELFFVILLSTGFCATTSYRFYDYPMTWHDAETYCFDGRTTLVQTDDVFNSNWKNLGYSKAWIGLITSTSVWHHISNETAQYFNWSSGQPDNLLSELCVSMTEVGDWYNCNCSELKQSVCYDGRNFSIETERNWMDAVINCEAKNASLVQISNETMNAEIGNLLSNGTEIWIGIRREIIWVWYDTGEIYSSPNWKESQMENPTENELCAAIGLENWTVTKESCNALYPFICSEDVDFSQGSSSGSSGGSSGTSSGESTGESSGESSGIPSGGSSAPKVKQSKKTVVKLKIQTTANLGDPRVSAELEQQLHALLVNQGVTDFKLTWKKKPEKPST